MIVELGSESRLAFAMVSHPRLGAASLLCELDENIVRMVVELTTHTTRVIREMQPGDCFEVGPSEGSWAPRYVAVDWLGHIVVSDYDNHEVKVFKGEDGSLMRSVGEPGNQEGQLSHPLGIAVSREGNFVVADSRNHRLQIFGRDGSFVRTIGCKGQQEGELQFPMGVAVDLAGNIAVADWGNNRIQIFDADGRFQRAFGRLGAGDGELKCPSGVAWNDEGTALVVADGQNHRVQVFEADGTHKCSIRHPESDGGDSPGELNGPMGIAVDSSGNIVVADKNDRVQVIRQDGTFIHAVGRNGRGPGELHGPGGVAVDGAGNIVVADCKNRRVQVFSRP